MRIDRKYRPELCSDHFGMRPELSYVNVTTFNGIDVAIGADGFILAVVPVEMEPDDFPGLVPHSCFTYARKFSSGDFSSMILGAYEVMFSNNWSAPRSMHSKFNKPMEFPDIGKIAARTKGDLQPVFGVNPKLLTTAAKAIGYDPFQSPIYIHRDRDTGPLVIALEYQDGVPVPPFALVMPLHLSGLPGAQMAEPKRKRVAR